MSWKIFEKECVTYLTEKYGYLFKLKGTSDSTISDIFFNNGRKQFYIEAKMPKAQCGQFVLLPNLKNRTFIYSTKNKTKENECTKMIIDFMNKRFDYFNSAGTSGINIEMSKTIFYRWIISYYKNKGVEFFITKDKNKFIIFPIEQFSKYFNVTAKYREKKSGSSSLNNSNKADFEYAMDQTGIEYRFNGLDVVSDSDINGLKVNGNKYDYILRKNDNTYNVRKLSNTRNANIIFSIELKCYDINQYQCDKLEFEKVISN